MSSRFETVATGILVACAIGVASAAIHREFGQARQPVDWAPSYVEGWREWIADAIVIGDEDAPVQIVKFADLQCPFCGRFAESLDEARHDYGEDVAIAFLHFPLSMHPEAQAAAIAAECAAEQGRFEQFLGAVFARQDSIATRPWSAYAADGQVPDSSSFKACISQPASAFPRIQRGIDIGKELQIRGTPTVVINGWWLKRVPLPYDTLSSMIRRVLNGMRPVE